MDKITLLSHPYTSKVPVYGGGSEFIDIRSIKSIQAGDSCNVYYFGMNNHWGTHVDGPNHFHESGMTVVDYPPETWFFTSPKLVSLELEPGQIVNVADLVDHVDGDVDFLLIQSNWTRFRGEDVYGRNNPGLSPDIADWLRHFPRIRAVGIDWISVSSFANRELGREAHRAFLKPDGPPFLLIEDMNLSDIGGNLLLKQVVVAPLFVTGLDSVPCTVYGICEERRQSQYGHTERNR